MDSFVWLFVCCLLFCFVSFFLIFKQRGYTPSTEKEAVLSSDEDAITYIMERHGQFVGSIQSRLFKLQVI